MITNLKSQTEFSGFYIVYYGSTNIEAEGTRGASHLLEHLLCKQFTDLRNDLQRNGVDWNATTSNNHVRFYFTGLEESLSKFRDKLVDRITNFTVTKKDFEIERKIVLEEYGNTFASKNTRHFYNFLRTNLDHFAPIGSKEDLESMKWMDMIKFWENNYQQPGKIINVSKRFKWEDDSISFSKKETIKDWKIAKYSNKLEERKEEDKQSSIIMMTKLFDEDISTLKLFSKLLSSGLESPLYKIAREKHGLCYSIDSDVIQFAKKAAIMIDTETAKKNEKKLIQVIRDTLEEAEKHIDKKRFQIIRENLMTQKKKQQINRYLHVDDEINGKENSILYNIESTKIDRVIKLIKEINGQELIISGN